jgi:hypothetical protein
MNRRFAAATAALLMLAVAGCKDRETKPVERPLVPAQETQGAALQEDAAMTAVLAVLAPEKTFADATARLAPLFAGQPAGQGGASAPALAQLQERLPDVIAQQRAALQQAFAPEELAAIAAFVATPAGQKFLAVLPQLQQETSEYAARIANTLVAKLVQQKLREGAVVAIEPLAPLQPAAATPATAPQAQDAVQKPAPDAGADAAPQAGAPQPR